MDASLLHTYAVKEKPGMLHSITGRMADDLFFILVGARKHLARPIRVKANALNNIGDGVQNDTALRLTNHLQPNS